MGSSGCAATSARSLRSADGKSPRCMVAMASRAAGLGSTDCAKTCGKMAAAYSQTSFKALPSGQTVLAVGQALLHFGDQVRFGREAVFQLEISGEGVFLLLHQLEHA